MGNGNSNSSSTSGSTSSSTSGSNSGLRNDFNVCVAQNTLNGNGFMGAQGDVAVVKCIAGRIADRAIENHNQDNQNTKTTSGRCGGYSSTVSGSTTRGSYHR